MNITHTQTFDFVVVLWWKSKFKVVEKKFSFPISRSWEDVAGSLFFQLLSKQAVFGEEDEPELSIFLSKTSSRSGRREETLLLSAWTDRVWGVRAGYNILFGGLTLLPVAGCACLPSRTTHSTAYKPGHACSRRTREEERRRRGGETSDRLLRKLDSTQHTTPHMLVLLEEELVVRTIHALTHTNTYAQDWYHWFVLSSHLLSHTGYTHTNVHTFWTPFHHPMHKHMRPLNVPFDFILQRIAFRSNHFPLALPMRFSWEIWCDLQFHS